MTSSPLSSSAVYVAAPEGDTGKSTVALGLLRIFAGTVQRVGVFRPVTVAPRVADTEPARDRIVEMLLQHTTVDLEYEECIGVTNARVHEDRDAALTEIVDRYHAVAQQCDVVVILGTDYTGVPSPTEFDFNATVAVNLGAPVLLVLRGADRTPEEIGTNARLTLDELRVEHAHPVGIVVNRCVPEELETIQSELAPLGLPAWTLPSQALLTAPTMGELLEAVDGTLYSGDSALLDREVMAVMVGGMTGDRILERLVDGMVVIVPADRTDAVLAILAAHAAEGFPSLAGMIWNGGLLPNSAMDRLVHGMRSTLPIVCTAHGTYDTARIAADTRGRVYSGSGRKVETALSLMEKHVDTEELLARLRVETPDVMTPQMFEHQLLERARADRRHIVLPEGDDDRILHAAGRLLRRDVADLTILGDSEAVRRRADELGIDLTGATILDPRTSEHAERFATEYTELRKHKGMTLDLARDRILDISYFATMMVHTGLADGMVSGAAHTTAHTIRPALEIIRTRPDVKTVSSVFLMCLADHVLAFGDCAVVPDPTAQQLADIALSSAETASRFGVEPRVALLSYSTGDSGSGADVDKVREATEIVRTRIAEAAAGDPVADLVVDGPLQFDAAVDPTVAAKKMPDSPVAGRATVLVFPDLNTGNNTYKAVQRTAGAVAIGPVLQGLRKPINDLSRGALIEDIVNTVAITAVQAQAASGAQESDS
ncbi:phosphate acetyltransferase [Rhodococcus sp. IEGM 1408]|uniref:phosphate acetyltransferase n=1 Tax=Rhodococcus sp. IEGM 1408 TaxID=3082220 RepID=UPI002954C137|nr:phosphate acetyltransferase [Rhodococcus sp. IEGM 1408]MDV8001638.1 phosphate acetyltransferase [Rhodococcus sp. IEGM 1408]